jgi:hypothetical protein
VTHLRIEGFKNDDSDAFENEGRSKMTTDTHFECPSLLANMNVTQPPYRPQLGTFFFLPARNTTFPSS